MGRGLGPIQKRVLEAINACDGWLTVEQLAHAAYPGEDLTPSKLDRTLRAANSLLGRFAIQRLRIVTDCGRSWQNCYISEAVQQARLAKLAAIRAAREGKAA